MITEVPTTPFLDLTVISGDTIQTSFTPPLSDGGSNINSYKVDCCSEKGNHWKIPFVQKIFSKV